MNFCKLYVLLSRPGWALLGAVSSNTWRAWLGYIFLLSHLPCVRWREINLFCILLSFFFADYLLAFTHIQSRYFQFNRLLFSLLTRSPSSLNAFLAIWSVRARLTGLTFTYSDFGLQSYLFSPTYMWYISCFRMFGNAIFAMLFNVIKERSLLTKFQFDIQKGQVWTSVEIFINR